MDRARRLLAERRGFLAPACAVLLAAGIAGSAFAFYIVSDVVEIEANSAKAKVEVVQSRAGDAVSVSARNAGTTPIYVRAMAFSEDGADGIDLAGGFWSARDMDGWCVYSSPVEPGEETGVLATVQDASGHGEVSVYAESVQAEGFPSAQDAFLGIRGMV